MSAENASSCDVGDSGDEDNISFIGHDDVGKYSQFFDTIIAGDKDLDTD